MEIKLIILAILFGVIAVFSQAPQRLPAQSQE
jgi:hypothetical protein